MTKSYHLIRSRQHRLSSSGSCTDGQMDTYIGLSSSKMSRKRIANGSTTSKQSSKSKCSNSKISSHKQLLICSCCFLVFSIIIYEYQYAILNFLLYLYQYSGIKKYLSDSQTVNGGWRLPDNDILQNYDSDICTIDRRNVSELNESEFETIYRHKRPLILQFVNGAADWTEPDKWSVDSLKHEYGEWTVVSGNAREIVRYGGTGYVQSSFSQYIDKQMRSKDPTGEPSYIFDRDFYNDSSLPSTLKPPKYLQIKDGVDDSIFFLGMSGSGVSFHKHADAWNGVIYGRKRWFLFPLETTPPGGVYPAFTQQEWYHQIYPHINPDDNNMVECVQNAGEILYLPESWYHGTINLGDTVAIGIQKKEAKTTIEKLFYKEGKVARTLHNKDGTERQTILRQRLNIMEDILRLLPDSAEVNMKTGSLHKELGNLQEAERLTRRAIQLDQYFVVAMLNLAAINYQLGKHETAVELYQRAEQLAPNLWDVYAHYGDFLLNTQRPNEAADMYKKGTLLQPDSLPLWTQLRHAQLITNDKQGAEQSLKQISRIKNM